MVTDDYIGIPFKDKGRSHAGADCWGLVRLVYAEVLGVMLPSYSDEYDTGGGGAETAILKHSRMWRKVDKPSAYDVALLRQGGKAQHVGLIVDDNMMLHTTRETGAVIERYTAPKWSANFLGAYRLP